MSETEGDQPQQAPEKPEKPGAMTEDQSRAAIAWINSRWSNQSCPFHGPTKWGIDTQFTWTPASGAPGSLMIGGPVFPFFVVTCAVCGYTVFVNAIRSGVLPGGA
jgi:hypothetical protein